MNRRFARRLAALSVLSLVTALAVPLSALETASSDNQGSFQAQWSVEGSLEGLELGNGRAANIFRHRGEIRMLSDAGRVGNTISKCIGFGDSFTGTQSRCVWVSGSGDRIYSEVRRETGKNQLTGRGQGLFVGGTGRFTGIKGSYDFEWVTDLAVVHDRIEARTVRMTGRYFIP